MTRGPGRWKASGCFLPNLSRPPRPLPAARRLVFFGAKPLSGIASVATWLPIRIGEAEVARVVDFSAALNPTGADPPEDTIASIGTVALRRLDGVAMTGVDLVGAGSPAIDNTGLFAVLALTPGLPGIDYVVATTILSLNGQTVVRDMIQPVAAFVGAAAAP